MANPMMKHGKGVGHRFSNPSFTAYADDYGEPMAGALQHAHLDSNMFFHPPSLRKDKDGKVNYVPTDDPGEKDDKYLDVTKRKQAHKQRMDLLKRSTPGGDPPQIPVRTTLISPTLSTYVPLLASTPKRRRRINGGMFVSYDRRGCL